ncbi:MAG TPA: TetR/AcrR family transcriptional regulator [Acidimicrobiales bacterium]|nr:TetR/AcrR family transcriptional regulator [Acidimicrobiales bacterium]
MSDEEGGAARPYRMTRRAGQVDDTRQRIVEATVHIHETLGPARTTISGIAEAAGVTRLTVYRHFPDDEALYEACSSHWQSAQVLPNLAAWAEIADSGARLTAGLTDLYRFYSDGRAMLASIFGAAEHLPAGQRRRLHERQTAIVGVLLSPFPKPGAQLRAVIGHAAGFSTWHSLCIEEDLSNAQAVTVMSTLVIVTSGSGLA